MHSLAASMTTLEMYFSPGGSGAARCFARKKTRHHRANDRFHWQDHLPRPRRLEVVVRPLGFKDDVKHGLIERAQTAVAASPPPPPLPRRSLQRRG